MINNDKNIFKLLIAGGLIGGTLGSILSKNKEEGITIAVIAGAAILATYKANELAQKTNQSVYVEEYGKLFEIKPNGEKS